MNTVIVNGGKRLAGEVRIGGSKNAALPVLFGGIVTGEVCVFSALPRVSDVLRSLEILHAMGARIRFLENKDVSVENVYMGDSLMKLCYDVSAQDS